MPCYYRRRGKGRDVDRFKARNEQEERWIADTAAALACAEKLAARLVELRGTADIEAVLAVQAEIAVLRRRVEALENEQRIARRELDPVWASPSAWNNISAR